MSVVRKCSECQEEFTPSPTQVRGDLCHDCHLALGIKEKVDKMGGVMIWEHKTAPEFQLMRSVKEAKKFNKTRNNRQLTGPTIRFDSREPEPEKAKDYTTPLRERRRLKW